jgi:hypothetical protein
VPDSGYAKFDGTMIYESAELVPVTLDFTMAEYQRQELSKQTSFEARAVDFLQRARREMATGRFDKATQLREYRQVPIRDQHAAKELRQLEIEEIQTGWFGKFLRLDCGFLILWAGAGLVLRVRRDRFPRHTLAAR